MRKRVKRQSNLLQVAHTLGLPRAHFTFSDDRQQEGGQNANNRDDHEQLDKRERTPQRTMRKCLHGVSLSLASTLGAVVVLRRFAQKHNPFKRQLHADRAQITLASPFPTQEASGMDRAKEIESILITEPQIAARIAELSREIERDFRGCELTVVAVLNGTVLFLADLIRHLDLPMRLDFVGVSSYGSGTQSGELVFTKELRLDVQGRDVLLVDDILDTGKTLQRVSAKLRQLKPNQIKTCVLLEKAAPRAVEIKADYVGFSIPNLFVVGYGLDFAESYRNLPFVGVLRPELYQNQ